MEKEIVKVNGMNVICGMTAGGKSTLIKFLIFKLLKDKKVDNCLVFTMTTTDYDYLPGGNVHTMITEEILARILNYQKLHSNLKLLLVFDDFIGAINFGWPICNVLNSQYRHYGLTLIYSTQYIYKIPPIVRENSDIVILFSQGTEKSIRACYECFGQDFERLSDFQDFLKNKTEGFNFLVINRKCSDRSRKHISAHVNIDTIPKGRIEFKEKK